jgi:hypothetical protein
LFGTFAMKFLGIAQARLDQFNVAFGAGDALFRFLLKRMEYVNDTGKTYGVNSPEGVAVKIIDYLEDSAAAESLERFAGSGSPPL